MTPAMMIRTTPRAIRVQLAIKNILARANPLWEGTSAASSNEMIRVCFYMALFTYDFFSLLELGLGIIYDMSMNDHHLLP